MIFRVFKIPFKNRPRKKYVFLFVSRWWWATSNIFWKISTLEKNVRQRKIRRSTKPEKCISERVRKHKIQFADDTFNNERPVSNDASNSHFRFNYRKVFHRSEQTKMHEELNMNELRKTGNEDEEENHRNFPQQRIVSFANRRVCVCARWTRQFQLLLQLKKKKRMWKMHCLLARVTFRSIGINATKREHLRLVASHCHLSICLSVILFFVLGRFTTVKRYFLDCHLLRMKLPRDESKHCLVIISLFQWCRHHTYSATKKKMHATDIKHHIDPWLKWHWLLIISICGKKNRKVTSCQAIKKEHQSNYGWCRKKKMSFDAIIWFSSIGFFYVFGKIPCQWHFSTIAQTTTNSISSIYPSVVMLQLISIPQRNEELKNTLFSPYAI